MFDGKPPEMKSGELLKRAEKRAEAEKDLAKASEQGDFMDQCISEMCASSIRSLIECFKKNPLYLNDLSVTGLLLEGGQGNHCPP